MRSVLALMLCALLGCSSETDSEEGTAEEFGGVLVSEATRNLIADRVTCSHFDEITPKGFARPVQVFRVEGHRDENGGDARRFSRVGERVEVNVIDGSDIRAAIEELRDIQREFERQFADE